MESNKEDFLLAINCFDYIVLSDLITITSASRSFSISNRSRSHLKFRSYIFFNWFKMLLGKEFKAIISEYLMVDLFRKKIIPSDLSLLKTLKVNGLECIVRLFVLVNEIEGNVLDLDP